MKKNIIILMLVGLFLTGCGDKKEVQKQNDYRSSLFQMLVGQETVETI